MSSEEMASQQLSAPVTIFLIALFFGGTLLMSILIGKKKENADGYMNAGHNIGFGIAATSMTATWIWASSMSLFHPEGAGHSPVPVSPNPF